MTYLGLCNSVVDEHRTFLGRYVGESVYDFPLGYIPTYNYTIIFPMVFFLTSPLVAWMILEKWVGYNNSDVPED